MSEEMLKELQDKLYHHDAQLLSHDKDIHSIAKSVESIDSSVKLMADLQARQAVRDERFDGMIEGVKEIAVRAHKRLDDNDNDKKKLVWLFITPIIVALLGTIIYKNTSNNSLDKKLDAIIKTIETK